MNDAEFRNLLDAEPPVVLKRSWKVSLLVGIITFFSLFAFIRSDFHNAFLLFIIILGFVYLFFDAYTSSNILVDDHTFSFGKKLRHRWCDVSGFHISYRHDLGPMARVTEGSPVEEKKKYVAYSYRKPGEALIDERAVSLLVPKRYGMNADQLAQLMNHWREKALRHNN